MYSKKVLEILKNPVNAGGLQGCDIVTKYENEETNEVYKIYIKLDETKQFVQEARFKTMGNPVAIAGSSALTNIIEGKTVDDMLEISGDIIATELGEVPVDKMYCLTDLINCLQNGINDYLKKIDKLNKR